MKAEILAILDRSGSMSNCVADTLRGYNGFLDSQKEEGAGWNDVRLTTVLFDDRYEVLLQAVPMLETLPLTDREYFVRGNTALYDAVGLTLSNAGERIDGLPASARPEHVVVLIITDGQENASHRFSAADVKRLVGDRKRAGWEFFFLGAELDSFADADRMGIDRNRQAGFTKSDSLSSYRHMSRSIKDYMKSGTVDENWDDGIKSGDKQP